MSALKCAPHFHSISVCTEHFFLHFISLNFSFPVVLCFHISSLFFYFHVFISLSKQITGYLYSLTACFRRGLASSLPFSFPNFLCFHMLSPAFSFPLFAAEISLSYVNEISLKKKISFQVILVRPLVPWTRISSVYWHVIVTLPSRPLTLLEQRIQANWK